MFWLGPLGPPAPKVLGSDSKIYLESTCCPDLIYNLRVTGRRGGSRASVAPRGDSGGPASSRVCRLGHPCLPHKGSLQPVESRFKDGNTLRYVSTTSSSCRIDTLPLFCMGYPTGMRTTPVLRGRPNRHGVAAPHHTTPHPHPHMPPPHTTYIPMYPRHTTCTPMHPPHNTVISHLNGHRFEQI